ncbi:ABC transporter substrate-binding protein [Streptomyces himalayensis]|uniref:ABC transporter substrate-binding protein n=2 Tax=Streptomyces himalayensis TaxID=2820085 RepID=A0A7W2D7Q5_9ACTN|nr:ABC transporter substrate-binding protein [Streptomyces himalayensis]MBA2949351.1 ABC transporter substrate-binding protein [Streptomyces himalayensis subsp. himalayensis]MBA4866184.1 ABC transporter substrate-binding protein [Streptomyces himalayensis subsp. aureolus]
MSVRTRVALSAALIAPLLLAGCAGTTASTAESKNVADVKIPEKVDPDTTLTIGSPEIHVALKLSGEIDKLPFKAKWANLSGGPQCSEAFRAHSLDVCSAAEIPSIHAHWTGLDTKLVAAEFRKDPIDHPTYELGIAPGADIDSLKDLRGKKIAYSPGQAQGALVLRILAKAGLTKEDVELVELPSTGDAYPTALGSRQVDAAPLGSVNIKRYPAKYGKDGAKTIPHGLRDDPGHLWVPTEAVSDPEKAAAIREFVKFWARAQVWIDQHPDEWIEGYYIKDQGLTREDGEYLVKQNGHPDIPADWTSAIERQQGTIDLLAKETGKESFDAETLFDRRYESVAADAIKSDAEAGS